MIAFIFVYLSFSCRPDRVVWCVFFQLWLTSLLQFFPPEAQCSVGLFIGTLYLWIILLVGPYIRRIDDRLAQFIQVQLCCILLMGSTLQHVEFERYSKEDALGSAVLLVILFALVILLLYHGILFARNWYRNWQRGRNLKEIVTMEANPMAAVITEQPNEPVAIGEEDGETFDDDENNNDDDADDDWEGDMRGRSAGTIDIKDQTMNKLMSSPGAAGTGTGGSGGAGVGGGGLAPPRVRGHHRVNSHNIHGLTTGAFFNPYPASPPLKRPDPSSPSSRDSNANGSGFYVIDPAASPRSTASGGGGYSDIPSPVAADAPAPAPRGDAVPLSRFPKSIQNKILAERKQEKEEKKPPLPSEPPFVELQPTAPLIVITPPSVDPVIAPATMILPPAPPRPSELDPAAIAAVEAPEPQPLPPAPVTMRAPPPPPPKRATPALPPVPGTKSPPPPPPPRATPVLPSIPVASPAPTSGAAGLRLPSPPSKPPVPAPPPSVAARKPPALPPPPVPTAVPPPDDDDGDEVAPPPPAVNDGDE